MDREAFDQKYTRQLNPQQLEAVHAVEGAVLLLAVPGSGKTTVLVTRLGYMLCCCGIPAEKILTMTYTKAATKEMKQRFSALFGRDCPKIPEFRTINGVSSKIIAYYAQTHGSGAAFTLMEDEGRLSKLVADLYRDLNGEFASQNVTRELRKWITFVKNQILGEQEIAELDTGFDRFPELFKQYNLLLRQQQWMDYDDQMVYAKRVLEQYPDILAHFQETFPYICVDESQDTSKIQHAIIHLLAQKDGNLFMVGDEDQSIYGFRAAYPDALMAFEETYPGARVLLMEENYRSTPEILQSADRFIQKNRDRHPKTIHPTRASGANIHLISVVDRAAQYGWLAKVAEQGKDGTAILYRNNDSALPLIDLLDRRGIPYRCRQMDDTFFTHRIVTDILDILAFAHDPRNGEIFLRIYYKFGGGISRKAADFACEKSSATGMPILAALRSFPQLSQYARDHVPNLMGTLPKLLQDTALCGLNRIWKELRYMDYVEQMQLDANKFEILCLLAEQEESLDALAERLDRLRQLVSESGRTGGGILLSTVHSSKGLEYDRVYLLDVLDGILPAQPEPKGTEETKQYQEERRLFYVAMTRARDHLYLFSCLCRSASFIKEVQQNLPVEMPEPEDVFGSLPRDLFGKRYHHGEKGWGTILASCEGLCMIAYPDGTTQFLTVGQMYDQRSIVRKIPEKPAAPKKNAKPVEKKTAEKTKPEKVTLTAEERAELIEKAKPGRRVNHNAFGSGIVMNYGNGVVSIRFPALGEKKFVLLDVVRRGLLRFDEE